MWPGAEDLLTVARAAQVRQPAGNNKDCGLCALLSTVSTLFRLPRPATFCPRWTCSGGDGPQQGHGACGAPALAGGPARNGTGCPPALYAPLPVADIGRQASLPDAQLQHALLCLTVAEGGMSLVVWVSVQHVKDALQRHRPHAP